MKRLLIATACLLAVTLPSRARAEEASATSFAQTVRTLARVLAATESRSVLPDLLTDDAEQRRFDEPTWESARQLAERMPALPAVSVRDGSHPVVTAASDLAYDLEQAEQVPDSIREQVVPSPEAARAADAIAARWITSLLDASANEPIALLAFYDDGTADLDAGITARKPTLRLVLVKGRLEADGTVRICRIVYGTLEQV